MSDIKKISIGSDELDLDDYQKKLTAGSNIQIASNGTISATDTTYNDFSGSTAQQAGSHGLVPAPTTSDPDKFLKGDGSWATPPGTTYTAGSNVQISSANVISATDTTYSPGNGLDLTGTEFSVDSSVVALQEDLPTKTSDLTNDGSDGTSTYVESDELSSVATSGSYSDLSNKPTIGNATLTVKKNGITVDTFTANATSNKTINITVPTTAADVSALPSSTKYGTSISVSINSSDYKITTTLKDQDGNTLGTAQVIDLPLESVVVNGSYDSTNKKIVLTLQNGNTINIPVGDLVAGLQTEITSTNKLSADLVDDSTTTHKFTTASDITKLAGIASGAEVNQNAFSNVKVGSTTVAADSKTDTLELVAGPNVTLTPDATNDKVTIAATDTTYSNFTGATSSAAGASGLVPAPASGETDKYLKSDGTWATVQGGGSSYTAGDHIDITNNVIKAKDYVHSESPVSTSSTPSISGSEISNGSITANKLATGAVLTLQTTTTDPGEGSALAENTLLAVYNQPHEYKSGEFLVTAQNTQELNWNGTTCSCWSSGTWTQYGRMKKTTNPAILQLTNHSSNTWTIEVSMSCPTVNVPENCYIESGLCDITLPYTITKRISQTTVSCNGGSTSIWTSYSCKKIITLAAGATRNIGAFVRTSSSNSAVWKGGDELSGTAGNTNFGGAACILEARLIDDGTS